MWGRATAEHSPLGSPDTSLLRRRVQYVCVRAFVRKGVHTLSCMRVSKRSDSADPAASAHPTPSSSTPLLPLYGNAHRSPSQLLNLILSWRGKEKGSNGLAEVWIVEFFIPFTLSFALILETDCEDIHGAEHVSIWLSSTDTHAGTQSHVVH